MSSETDNFCVLPFMEFNLNPNGAAQPCCAYGRAIQKDGRAMSAYEHSVEEIWNSDDLRETRRKLIAGEDEPACGYCARMAEQKLRPMSLDANEMWAGNVVYNPERETIEQLKQRAIANDYRMGVGGTMLNLDVGNLCNLKCRMCHAKFSSMISNDPVHSKWSFVHEQVARWKGSRLGLAPRKVIGVTYEGLSHLDRTNAETVWLTGPARISMTPVPAGVSALEIKLRNARDEAAHVTISINSQTIFDGEIAGLQWLHETFELQVADLGGSLDLRVETSGSLFGIEDVALLRSERGGNHVAFSRFPNGEQWFQNRDFLLGELLKNAADIKQVNLIGGEPMLIEQCTDVVRHLVESGNAKHMVLSITTNGMVIPEGWLELASHFRQVTLTISLDGFGPISEYIRYPSKWEQIHANMLKFKALTNAYMLVNATVQIYNMLHVVDLIRFCDEFGIEFRYHFLIGPDHLSPMVVPESVRKEAGARVRQFAMRNDKSGASRSTHVVDRDAWLMQLASAFEADAPNWSEHKLREFMIFTNDLDSTRGQSFANTLPELKAMIEASGYAWIDEKRHAPA
jgi:MoaA/NifB/PqqE/SkfB family radical SAM enzyme